MECLRVLLKDYKNEIDDILVADKQLQKELIYDMQKYEAAKAKATVAEAVASRPKSGAFQSPDVSKNLTKTPGQTSGQSKHGNKFPNGSKVAAAKATTRFVLREVNKGTGTLKPKMRGLFSMVMVFCSLFVDSYVNLLATTTSCLFYKKSNNYSVVIWFGLNFY